MLRMNVVLLCLTTALAQVVSVTAQGPPAVCMPEVFQATVYDIYKNASVLVAWDIQRNLTVSVAEGVRHVFDLHKNENYLIKSPNDCVKTGSTEGNPLPFLCLPGSAKLVNDKLTSGFGGDALPVQLWDLELPSNATIKVVLTSQQPHVPVLISSASRPPVTTTSSTTLPDGTVLNTSETNVALGLTMLFTNPHTSVDPQLFHVPLTCLI
ncbi:unnamed protein product [Lymnaea stagnalis]|uniref:Uncharacterized protein n=1 Tax=Lymnaea stagnalis TaxID=6523 RepID=A0AAV2I2K9_LYMST